MQILIKYLLEVKVCAHLVDEWQYSDEERYNSNLMHTYILGFSSFLVGMTMKVRMKIGEEEP